MWAAKPTVKTYHPGSDKGYGPHTCDKDLRPNFAVYRYPESKKVGHDQEFH